VRVQGVGGAATGPPRAGPLAQPGAALAPLRLGADPLCIQKGPHARPLFRGDGVALRWGDGTVSGTHGDLSNFRRAQDNEGMVSKRIKAHE